MNLAGISVSSLNSCLPLWHLLSGIKKLTINLCDLDQIDDVDIGNIEKPLSSLEYLNHWVFKM